MVKRSNKYKLNKYLIPATVFIIITAIASTLAYLIFSSPNVVPLGSAQVNVNYSVVINNDDALPNQIVATPVEFNLISGSVDAYIRVSVNYSYKGIETLTDEEENYFRLLNSYGVQTIGNSSSDYQWSSNIGGCYYLLNGSGELLSLSDTTVRKFVADIDGVTFPDLAYISMQGVTPVDEITLDIKIQAIQSSNLNSSTFDGIVSLFERNFRDVSPNQCLVSFYNSSGNDVDSIIANNGVIIEAPTPSSNSGLAFGGWYYDPQFHFAYSSTDTIEHDTMLYANWVSGDTVVSFDTNGYQCVEVPNQSVASGYGFVLPCVIGSDLVPAEGEGFYWFDGDSDMFLTNTATTVSSATTFVLYFGSLPSASDFVYSYYDDGYGNLTATITGQNLATIPSHLIIPASTSYNGHIYKITGIGDEVFKNGSSLQSVAIPNTVTSLGSLTFAFCSGLTSIVLPSSLLTIGGDAFNTCSSLTTVTIPNSVTSIGAGAFGGCTSMTSIIIPFSVTSIYDYAFANCTVLGTVYYTGTSAQWTTLSGNIGTNNTDLTSADIYYFTSNGAGEIALGYWWYYGADGTVIEKIVS